MIDLLRCQHWITVCTKEQLIMIARLVSLFTVLSTLTTSNRIWWKEVQFKPNSWHTAKAWLAQSACNFSLVTRFICLLLLAKRCSLPTCNGTNLEKITVYRTTSKKLKLKSKLHSCCNTSLKNSILIRNHEKPYDPMGPM